MASHAVRHRKGRDCISFLGRGPQNTSLFLRGADDEVNMRSTETNHGKASIEQRSRLRVTLLCETFADFQVLGDSSGYADESSFQDNFECCDSRLLLSWSRSTLPPDSTTDLGFRSNRIEKGVIFDQVSIPNVFSRKVICRKEPARFVAGNCPRKSRSHSPVVQSDASSAEPSLVLIEF